jgi:putative addiction module antidote
MSEIKLRRVGNSLTITVPVHVAERMKVAEGDSVYLTELPGQGYRLTPHDPELVEQIKVMDDLMSRYRHTLKALSE